MFQFCNLCNNSLQVVQETPLVCSHDTNSYSSCHIQREDDQQFVEVHRRDQDISEEGNIFLSNFLQSDHAFLENNVIQLRGSELDYLTYFNERYSDSFQNDPSEISEEVMGLSHYLFSDEELNLRDSEGAQRVEKQSRLSQKNGKNQYDKNIPGNVVLTVLAQMTRNKYSKEIQYYCRKLETSFQKVIDFAKKSQNARKKIGTSWIGDCFSGKNAQNKTHKVFGLFMVRFLREQYYSHILKIGKMRQKLKYLECATNLMYVPRLQQNEYELISRFQ